MSNLPAPPCVQEYRVQQGEHCPCASLAGAEMNPTTIMAARRTTFLRFLVLIDIFYPPPRRVKLFFIRKASLQKSLRKFSPLAKLHFPVQRGGVPDLRWQRAVNRTRPGTETQSGIRRESGANRTQKMAPAVHKNPGAFCPQCLIRRCPRPGNRGLISFRAPNACPPRTLVVRAREDECRHGRGMGSYGGEDVRPAERFPGIGGSYARFCGSPFARGSGPAVKFNGSGRTLFAWRRWWRRGLLPGAAPGARR